MQSKMVDFVEKVGENISDSSPLQSKEIIDLNLTNESGALNDDLKRAAYNIRIRDMETRIKRLEARNALLLEEYEGMESLMKNVDVETADEIALFNRLIASESERVEETRKTIEDIEKNREEEAKEHSENVGSSNEEFEKKRVVLTSSIKALNAKINTLEDYKETRKALLEKLKVRDEILKQNEEEIVQRKEAIDRKFKLDREKLRNEMYTKLLALAGNLELEISKTKSVPVHRLMRENIFIKAELSQIVDEALRKKDNCERMRTMKGVHRQSIKSNSKDARKNLIAVKIKQCLLKAINKIHSSMKERLENLEKPKGYSQEYYDNLADSIQAEVTKVATRTRKLEVLLYKENIKLAEAKYHLNQTDFRAKIYEEILYDVKYAVACALKMADSGEDILEMSESELISTLLDLFTKGQSQIDRYLASASNESIPRPNSVYAKGNLGFEPKHIEFEEVIFEELQEEQLPDPILLATSPIIDLSTPVESLQAVDAIQSSSSTSTTEESGETSRKTISPESQESSDYLEDISEASDSMMLENEESLNMELEDE